MTEKNALSQNEKLVLACIPYGESNAITTKQLAKRINLDARAVRRIVNHLRFKGYLIGASKKTHKGYYKINSYSEGVNTLKMLQHQRDKTSKLIAVFKKSLNADKGVFSDTPIYNINSEQLTLGGEKVEDHTWWWTAKTDSRFNYWFC